MEFNLFVYVGHEYFYLKLFRQFCHLITMKYSVFKILYEKKYIQLSDFLLNF